jgi:hypothetical protein
MMCPSLEGAGPRTRRVNEIPFIGIYFLCVEVYGARRALSISSPTERRGGNRRKGFPEVATLACMGLYFPTIGYEFR